MFLNYIDYLTPWHLKLLEFLNGYYSWGEETRENPPENFNYSHAELLERTFKALRDQRAFYDLLVQDLIGRGLLKTDADVHRRHEPSEVLAALTTDIGRRFLDFTSPPSP
jgi:hypothetical protein